MDFHPVEQNLRQSFRILAAARERADVCEIEGVSIASLGATFQMFNAAFLASPVATEAEIGKAAADLLVLAAHKTYGQDVVVTRCSNNYGPYQFPEKLIPVVIQSVLARRSVPVYGDGMNVRDWLYVRDHAERIDDAGRRHLRRDQQ